MSGHYVDMKNQLGIDEVLADTSTTEPEDLLGKQYLA